MVEGAEYFSKIIPNSQVIIFDECGHFISHDKCEEAAKSIIKFIDQQSYSKVNDRKNSSIKSQKIDLSLIQTIAILCFFLAFIFINNNNYFFTYSY